MQSIDLEKLLALSYVFGGFLPFVLAAGKPISGTRFDPHGIAGRLREGFGWDVNGDFVQLYVGDLLRDGLVQRQDDQFYWTDKAWREESAEGAQQLAALREKFFAFSEELAGKLFHNLGPEERLHQLATALVTNRLFSEDSLEAFASVSESEDQRDTDDIDYVCARFIRHCYRSDRASYDALTALSHVGIICQLGTFFSRPPPTEKITSRLLIVLDGPFLVDLLGFCGEDRRADAAMTVKLAKERKARIAVFSHSVDEARDVIRGVLLNEPSLRFGPTAAALRNGSVSKAILDAFVQTPRQIVEGTKIVDEIIAPNDKRIYGGAEYFDEGDWQVLFGGLSGWTKDLAKTRDCDSVRNIMRLRRGVASKGVWGSGAVMLTSNLSLARVSKDVCVERDLLDAGSIGPVVSRFQLAALLWWSGGSKEKAEIASTHLMAAAAAFLSRDGSLIRKVQRYAFGVDKQRKELVEAFVRTPLSYEFLQDATLGGSLDVDESVVSGVLDRLVEHGRREGADVEKARSLAQVEAERAALEASEKAAEKLEAAKRDAEQAAAKSAAERAAAEAARAVAEAEVERLRKVHEAAEAAVNAREALALVQLERAKRTHNVIVGLLQSREEVWSRSHHTMTTIAACGRWFVIALLCLGVAALSTAATANVGVGWMFGAVAFFCGLAATRLFDGGRELERKIARWCTTQFLEQQRSQLNGELGPGAPAVVLDISESAVSVSNKEEIIACFEG